MKILIVDDEKSIRELVAIYCKMVLPDAETRCAESMAKARDILAEGFAPDFVISDHHLPDGNGPMLFAAYREANPRAFILLSSSDVQKPLGADAFSPKIDLRKTLAGHLRFQAERLSEN